MLCSHFGASFTEVSHASTYFHTSESHVPRICADYTAFMTVRKAYYEAMESMNNPTITNDDRRRFLHASWITLHDTVSNVPRHYEPVSPAALFKQILGDEAFDEATNDGSFEEAMIVTSLLYSLSGTILQSRISRTTSRYVRLCATNEVALGFVRYSGRLNVSTHTTADVQGDDLADMLGGLGLGVQEGHEQDAEMNG